MIELANVSATISVAVDELYEYVTNLENYGSWFPGVVAINSKNELPHATIGKTYLETLMLPDGECELTIEVIQCEVNKHFLTQGNLEGLLPQMTMTFSKQEAERCLLNLSYQSRAEGLSEDSEVVRSLKNDLKARASQGLENLQKRFER